MALPRLEPRDGEDSVLPEGIHACDERDLQTTFVNAFPHSRRRPRIAAGFLRLRSDLAGHGINTTQWIDGSFVTGKPEPEDVDVVSFARSALLDALPMEAQRFMETLADEARSKLTYFTHHFTVPIYPEHDARYPAFDATRRYWRKWWGRTRRGTPKGFLSMTTGDPATAPAVS
jgi:hypothetical protein